MEQRKRKQVQAEKWQAKTIGNSGKLYEFALIEEACSKISVEKYKVGKFVEY